MDNNSDVGGGGKSDGVVLPLCGPSPSEKPAGKRPGCTGYHVMRPGDRVSFGELCVGLKEIRGKRVTLQIYRPHGMKPVWMKKGSAKDEAE